MSEIKEPKPKIAYTNYRVVVEPEDPTFLRNATADEMRVACETLVRQIKRHVDGISYAAVQWDVEKSCPLCGWKWHEPLDPEYGNGCCDKHIEEWEAFKKAEAVGQ